MLQRFARVAAGPSSAGSPLLLAKRVAGPHAAAAAATLQHGLCAKPMLARSLSGTTLSAEMGTGAMLSRGGVLRRRGTGRGRMLTRSFADYPDHEVMPMPALSPTMEAGTIAAWKLAEGDSFKDGDVIAEVETDKATVDMVATDDGVLAK
jgi:pyruvate dehydrogenase E2 component (dihydrolipoamide acetyltransferase)